MTKKKLKPEKALELLKAFETEKGNSLGLDQQNSLCGEIEKLERFSRVEKEISEEMIKSHDDPVKEGRRRKAQDIVNRFLLTEFETLGKNVICVLIEKLENWANACVLLEEKYNQESLAYIFINDKRWKDRPESFEKDLKDILRHELTHLSTGWKDEDPRFQKELKKRGIKRITNTFKPFSE